MKWVWRIVAALVAVLFLLYVLLFTSIGNSITKPFIEDNIRSATQLQSASLETFSLSLGSFHIVLKLTPENTIEAKGEYSLFSQSVDGMYDVRLLKLEALQKLTKQLLRGEIALNGTFKGDKTQLLIDGKSGMFASNTNFAAELKEFKPSHIKATIKNMKLEKVLYTLNKPAYATALLNLDADVNVVADNLYEGDVLYSMLDGIVNTAIMKSDFNVTLPPTQFKTTADIKLQKEKALIDYAFISNLATLRLDGHSVIDTQYVDLNYSVDVEKLEAFKPVTNAPLRGPLALKGRIIGDKEKMTVTTDGIVAKGKTTLKANLIAFKPDSVEAKITDMDIHSLLYMVEQPYYSDGKLSIDAKIPNARMGELKGNVLTTVTQGQLNSSVLHKQFKFKQQPPRISYNVNIATSLDGNKATSTSNITSTLLDLNTQKTVYDIKEGSLQTDYKAYLKDFSKLYFATEQKMRGKTTITGDVTKTNNETIATAHTEMLDGVMDFKIHNDDVNAKINNMETLKALHMMYYPEIFTSKINLTLDYNLKDKKGKFFNVLDEGHYVQNEMTNLVKRFTGFDLTKEVLKYELHTDINGDETVSKVEMASKNAKITSNKMEVNTKTQDINIPLNIEVIGIPVALRIYGNANKPKYDIDAGKTMEATGKKEAKKAINEQLNQHLDSSKEGKKVKDLLNNLF